MAEYGTTKHPRAELPERLRYNADRIVAVSGNGHGALAFKLMNEAATEIVYLRDQLARVRMKRRNMIRNLRELEHRVVLLHHGEEHHRAVYASMSTQNRQALARLGELSRGLKAAEQAVRAAYTHPDATADLKHAMKFGAGSDAVNAVMETRPHA